MISALRRFGPYRPPDAHSHSCLRSHCVKGRRAIPTVWFTQADDPQFGLDKAPRPFYKPHTVKRFGAAGRPGSSVGRACD